jgi:hypothetical protein
MPADPGLEHLGVGHRGVDHAVVAPAVGLAPLQLGVAIGGAAEDLREFPLQDRLAVARPHVRDGVEPDVLLGEVGEQARGHLGELREVALELGRARAGDGELAPAHDAAALGDEAHQARVREVEEMARH